MCADLRLLCACLKIPATRSLLVFSAGNEQCCKFRSSAGIMSACLLAGGTSVSHLATSTIVLISTLSALGGCALLTILVFVITRLRAVCITVLYFPKVVHRVLRPPLLSPVCGVFTPALKYYSTNCACGQKSCSRCPSENTVR